MPDHRMRQNNILFFAFKPNNITINDIDGQIFVINTLKLGVKGYVKLP
jgi:hypothetical protein